MKSRQSVVRPEESAPLLFRSIQWLAIDFIQYAFCSSPCLCDSEVGLFFICVDLRNLRRRVLLFPDPRLSALIRGKLWLFFSVPPCLRRRFLLFQSPDLAFPICACQRSSAAKGFWSAPLLSRHAVLLQFSVRLYGGPGGFIFAFFPWCCCSAVRRLSRPSLRPPHAAFGHHYCWRGVA